jgi:hypothetical protein
VAAFAAARSRAKFLRDIGLYNAVQKRLFLCCIAMLPVGHKPSAQHHIVVAGWPKVAAAAIFEWVRFCAGTSPSPEASDAPKPPARLVSSICAGISATPVTWQPQPYSSSHRQSGACFSRASERPKMRFATEKRVTALKRLRLGRGPNSPWGASWGPREPPLHVTLGSGPTPSGNRT